MAVDMSFLIADPDYYEQWDTLAPGVDEAPVGGPGRDRRAVRAHRPVFHLPPGMSDPFRETTPARAAGPVTMQQRQHLPVTPLTVAICRAPARVSGKR